MQIEVEMKFAVGSHAADVRARLENLGARFESPMQQTDTYFAHPSRDFARTDEALRIRRIGDDNFITYKGPKLDQQTKARRELELPIAAGTSGYEQFAELLTTLGFQRFADVRKTRQPAHVLWQNEQVEVAIDDVAGVGQYVELELVVEQEKLAQAREVILSLAATIGLEASERRGYLELLLTSPP